MRTIQLFELKIKAQFFESQGFLKVEPRLLIPSQTNRQERKDREVLGVFFAHFAGLAV
jgi:hypothetical protein